MGKGRSGGRSVETSESQERLGRERAWMGFYQMGDGKRGTCKVGGGSIGKGRSRIVGGIDAHLRALEYSLLISLASSAIGPAATLCQLCLWIAANLGGE